MPSTSTRAWLAQAIAPLLHVAEVVGRGVAEQAQIASYGQAVDHAGRGPFLVASAASIQDAVFDFATERVPLPGVRIADTDCVDVAVVEQCARPRPDTPKDVAHAVEPHLVKTQLFHFCGDALTHLPNLAVHAGNGADLSEKRDHRWGVFGSMTVDLDSKVWGHWSSFRDSHEHAAQLLQG